MTREKISGCLWTTSSLSGIRCGRSCRLISVAQFLGGACDRGGGSHVVRRCDPTVVVMDSQTPRVNDLGDGLIKRFLSPSS
jgi:hypothetical protein